MVIVSLGPPERVGPYIRDCFTALSIPSTQQHALHYGDSDLMSTQKARDHRTLASERWTFKTADHRLPEDAASYWSQTDANGGGSPNSISE